MLPTVADVSVHDPSLCLSVTLVHPAKADGHNEMPFARDTCVVPSNTVFDRGPVSPQDGEIWGRNLESKFALQFAANRYREWKGFYRQATGTQQFPI